jgi:DNA-binding NarL/FixJ family response regulator
VRHAQGKGIVKILVVDDHPLMREALRTVLQQLGSPTVVLEAQDCPTALVFAEGHVDLDLVLLDLALPGIHGLDALAVLRERYPELPVVVLSADEGQQTVLQAIERGAMGFIPKSSPREVMLSALRLVMAGGIYLPPTVLQQPVSESGSELAGGIRPQGAPPRTPADLGLTARQVQVLRLLLQGKSNKLICRELDLAEGTVKIHVSAILKALQVTSRTQAVIAVGRMGLRIDDIDGPAATGSVD